MTNLYDLLRRVKADAEKATPGTVPLSNPPARFVPITDQDLEFLNQFFQATDVDLHFKARDTGEKDKDGEAIMAVDLAIAGDGFEVFAVLCEAMVQNYQFADMAMRAVAFYRDHIPNCPECSKKHFGQQKPVLSWKFEPHKPQ